MRRARDNRRRGRAGVLALGLVLSASGAAAQRDARGRDDSRDARCELLLTQAVAELAAEQYPRMLELAEDRRMLCPDPVSAFLVGLAQANLVDSLSISDPAQNEQTRLSALKNLRVAAAGASALPPRWQYTAHEWIVHLQAIAPSGTGPLVEAEPEPLSDWDEEPLEIPPAPPPQPQPVFPWGPVLTTTLALASLTTGVVLYASASDKSAEARSAAKELVHLSETDAANREQLATWARDTQRLHDEAKSESAWGTTFLIGGAGGLVLAGVWYWLLPPDGKWRWAALPSGASATVRF